MSDIFDLFMKISGERERTSANQGPITHIVAGLGNPGKKYELTRHNAGFMALSYLSQKENIKIDRLKFKALVKDHEFAGKRVLFMLPQTLMNASGEAVREAADFYKIPAENIIVIQDDIALPAGKMRIRTKGSDGGQKGIRSVIKEIGSQNFIRIKLGVGSPPDPSQTVNWVLGKLPQNEQADFYARIEDTYEALKLILAGDISRAMNKYN